MTTGKTESKQFYHEKAIALMDGHLVHPNWTLLQKMALACRILAAEGHESALAGQISVRAQNPDTYWMLSYGYGFDEAMASRMLLVDDELNVVQGDGMPNPANRFHLWVYRHRPEINCLIHTHAPYVSALSMIGEELAIAHMDTCMLYDDCAYLKDWPGLPIGDEEGEIITTALGSKRAVLLAHHGQLVTGTNIEEATMLGIWIERAARLHLLARSIGPIMPIDPARAREAHDWRYLPKAVGATFSYFARRILRQSEECMQ
jgi:L-fuculose-phosphate aldolase